MKKVFWIVLLASCGTARNPAMIERPPQTAEEWRELANREPSAAAPKIAVAYDSIQKKDWNEFDKLALELEGRTGEPSALDGPLGTLYLSASNYAPSERTMIYLEKARRLLDRSAKQESVDPSTLFNLGMASYLMKDYATASKVLLQYMERNPGDSKAVKLLVCALAESGDPVSGLKWIERAYGAAQSVERLELTGLCYYMMGQAALASDAFNAAIKLEPNNARLWHNLGLVYSERGNSQMAKMCFDKADTLRRRK
jgi:Flp pilus assembly protein TadD